MTRSSLGLKGGRRNGKNGSGRNGGQNNGGGSIGGRNNGGGSNGGRSGRDSDTSRQGSGKSSGRRNSDVVSSTMRRVSQHQRDERVTTPSRTRSPSPSFDSDYDDDDDSHPEIPVPIANSRKWCYIWKSRLVSDDDTVDSRISRVMTQIFKKSIVDNGFQWKNIPESHVDMYFNELKKFYRWAEDDTCVKVIFIKHGRRRYSDMICKWKKKRSEVQPPMVSDEGWAQFNAYWDAEDTKAAKMSQNRKSETGGPGSGFSIHVGGSLSTRGHAKILKKQLGREPNYFELMHKTHFKKDGSGYCDKRAEKIAVEIEARKADLSEQDESGESVNMNNLYIEVVGVKKQRIFGTGEVGCSYKSIVTSTASQSENEELLHKVATLTNELEEERNARATQAEDERAARDEMEKRLTSAMDERVAQVTADLMKQFEERFRQQST